MEVLFYKDSLRGLAADDAYRHQLLNFSVVFDGNKNDEDGEDGEDEEGGEEKDADDDGMTTAAMDSVDAQRAVKSTVVKRTAAGGDAESNFVSLQEPHRALIVPMVRREGVCA